MKCLLSLVNSGGLASFLFPLSYDLKKSIKPPLELNWLSVMEFSHYILLRQWRLSGFYFCSFFIALSQSSNHVLNTEVDGVKVSVSSCRRTELECESVECLVQRNHESWGK